MLEKVKEVLHNILRLEDVTEDTEIFGISGVTVIDQIEIIMTLEADLNIDITDEEAEPIKTVKDLVELITKKTEEKNKKEGDRKK